MGRLFIRDRRKPDSYGGCENCLQNDIENSPAKDVQNYRVQKSMTSPDYEFDYNEIPLAYLITVRTYGTWLHGDERMSVDRHGKNVYGTKRVAPSKNLKTRMDENTKRSAFLLNRKQRKRVEKTIDEVCKYRTYELMALSVRTNHFHAVVFAGCKPEVVIHAFKSYSTRAMREEGLIDQDTIPWARGGSRRYLWKPKSVSLAVDYVLNGQGADLNRFDES